VGNVQLSDIALVNSVQNGFKFGSVVVEVLSHLGDDFALWEASLEVVGLSLQICALVSACDCSLASASFWRLLGAKELVDVLGVGKVLS